jgi:hypothetical protein
MNSPGGLLFAGRNPCLTLLLLVLLCCCVQVTKRAKAKVQARRSSVKTFIKVRHRQQQQRLQQQ